MEKGTFGYIITGFSQMLNSLIGKGDRDQSFCSRLHEGKILGIRWCGFLVKIIDPLFAAFGDKNHCKNSFNSDTERTYKG